MFKSLHVELTETKPCMASLHISRTSDILKENLHRCSMKNGIFDSNKLRNIKDNILLEISSKWETFNDSVKPQDGPTTSAISRKSKIRSVYGQPEVVMNEQQSSSSLQNGHWRSLDSLDTCDSGHGFGSNSTSCSDLRMQDSIKPVDTIVSDLGTSVESSDNEFELDNKRCLSSNSTSSGCSINSQQEDELAREAKYFMKQFVNKIFTNRFVQIYSLRRK